MMIKAHLAYLWLRLCGWRPIATAPRDGTMILGLETAGDYFNVMMMRYHIFYTSQELDEPKSGLLKTWWGLGFRCGFNTWDPDNGPYGHASDFACTPFLWKPRPKVPRLARLAQSWHYHMREREDTKRAS